MSMFKRLMLLSKYIYTYGFQDIETKYKQTHVLNAVHPNTERVEVLSPVIHTLRCIECYNSSFTQSIIHLISHSHHSFIHSHIHSLSHSLIHSFIWIFIHYFYIFIYTFIRSFDCSFVRSFVHSFIHSVIQSFSHFCLYIYFVCVLCLTFNILYNMLLAYTLFCMLYVYYSVMEDK